MILIFLIIKFFFDWQAGLIINTVKRSAYPELCTQAWCKFHEILSSYDVIKPRQNGEFNSLHLCEAPGAFVTSLNHYLQSRTTGNLKVYFFHVFQFCGRLIKQHVQCGYVIQGLIGHRRYQSIRRNVVMVNGLERYLKLLVQTLIVQLFTSELDDSHLFRLFLLILYKINLHFTYLCICLIKRVKKTRIFIYFHSSW